MHTSWARDFRVSVEERCTPTLTKESQVQANEDIAEGASITPITFFDDQLGDLDYGLCRLGVWQGERGRPL